MKYVKLFENFKFGMKKIIFLPNTATNEADRLQAMINPDAFVIYGRHDKEIADYRGDSYFYFEYYAGENYVPGSKKKSFSRFYEEKIVPARWRPEFDYLKSLMDIFEENDLDPEVFQMYLNDGAPDFEEWRIKHRGKIKGEKFGI